jgi:hypothetical protein
MEVLKLDIVGLYYYKPDMEIVYYEGNNTQYTKECVICKRLLLEPSYEKLSDNKNITNDNEILIGKCGHIFHSDCLGTWLKTSECCPVDKVKWCLHRVADTTTKLVMHNSSSNNDYKKKIYDGKKMDDVKNTNNQENIDNEEK